MISHITLGTRDLARARMLYDPMLQLLGWRLSFEAEDWLGWTPQDAESPLLSITLPEDGAPAAPGNGVMVALDAPSQSAVRKAHQIGLTKGGSAAGAPGLRPQYHANFYGGYLRDPDGNKLCICCQRAIAS